MDRLLAWVVIVLALAGCDAGTPYEVPPSIRETTVGEARMNSVDWDGDTLRMRGLVVLAHDKYDEVSNGNVGNIYISDPGNMPGHGMQIFAGQVRLHAYEQLMPGNIVNVQGLFVRFTGPPPTTFDGGRALDQFTFGTSIERVGFWEDPQPIELTAAEWLRDPARYVHSLIRITDPVRVVSGYTRMVSASGRPRLDPAEAETEDGLTVLISAELHQVPGLAAGQILDCGITGVANYFFNDTIMPRSAADIPLPGDPGCPE